MAIVTTNEPPSELLERMGSAAPTEILQVFEVTRARQDKVRSDSRYTDKAKGDQLAEIEAEGLQQFEAAFEQLKTSTQREFDQAEGQARAALMDAPPTFPMAALDHERDAVTVRVLHQHSKRTQEANLLAVIGIAPDLQEVARIFDEAEARGLELAMSSAVFRADALAERARRKSSSVTGTDQPDTRIARDLRA